MYVEPLFDLLTYTDRQTDMMKSIPAFAFVIHVVVVVVVEIFIHGAVKATSAIIIIIIIINSH